MNILGIVLFPFSVLYDLATRFRNYLYNIGYKRSFEFDTRVVAVGNLSVGGTGKSPMIEYLIRLLKTDKKITTLSRGYGRKTKGFRLASSDDTYKTIGDEPMQFYRKFKDINVSVGEERAVAIPFILAEQGDTDVILLDDAYQHRSVKPNCNILLTDFSRPFFHDFVLPSGRLREARKGAERADIIVVTKCQHEMDTGVMDFYQKEISRYADAPVFFSTIKYLSPVSINGSDEIPKDVFLFSGIANPATLRSHVSEKFNLIGEMQFGDHHDYSEEDVDKLVVAYNQMESDSKCLLTTEKDMVKLLTPEITAKLSGLPIFYLPIETVLLKDGNKFDSLVLKSINSDSH